MGPGLCKAQTLTNSEAAADLLDAVADRGELVRKVLTAGVRGVEVRLADQSQTAAHDAVAVLAAQRGLHARHALVRNPLHQADIELDLVPLDDSALDLEEGQADRSLPVLGALQYEVIQRIAAAGRETRASAVAGLGAGRAWGAHLGILARVCVREVCERKGKRVSVVTGSASKRNRV